MTLVISHLLCLLVGSAMTWGFIYLGQRSALHHFKAFNYPTIPTEPTGENTVDEIQEWTMPDLEEYNRQLADEWEAPIPGPAPIGDNGEGNIEDYENLTAKQ